MPAYKAPLRDIRFLMNEMLDYPAHYQTLTSGQNADAETVDMILEGAADYCENVLSPLNQSGDEEGCTFNNGEVTTPKGFKEAYDQFVMGGWQGLSYPEEFGGQGLPMSLNLIKSEMMGTANWSFTMYPGLSTGCMNTIMQFGTDEQKNTYMPKLVEGTWSGTMCLTEPQCGTDLGQVKTKAEPAADGTYKISGTKIFISAGEHDLTDNIIHIVLARLPDAPAGTRGISLFIVPKFIPTADGSVGERPSARCLQILLGGNAIQQVHHTPMCKQSDVLPHVFGCQLIQSLAHTLFHDPQGLAAVRRHPMRIALAPTHGVLWQVGFYFFESFTFKRTKPALAQALVCNRFKASASMFRRCASCASRRVAVSSSACNMARCCARVCSPACCHWLRRSCAMRSSACAPSTSKSMDCRRDR